MPVEMSDIVHVKQATSSVNIAMRNKGDFAHEYKSGCGVFHKAEPVVNYKC